MNRRFCLSLLTGLIGFCCGCGSQTYEQRLDESRRYFEYRQRVDEALEPHVWTAFGVEFRPPRGFRELPGPAKDGDPDTRQPAFFAQPLPGLLGAWQGDVRVEIQGSDLQTVPGYVFICTNHQRYLERATNPQVFPVELLDDVSNVLAATLRYEPNTAVNPWKFEEVRCPVGTAYVKRKVYDVIRLDGEIDVSGQRLRMDFRMFRYNVGDIQFALITVLPHADILDRRERIDSRIDLAMETLTMTGDAPRQQSAAPSAGGGF